MSDLEEKKAELKKLSSRALQAKMDLHDLSEELPQNWELILTVANKTFEAYQALEAARNELKELRGE